MWELLLCIFLVFNATTSDPFIFDKVLDTCSYNSAVDKFIFTSKIWRAEDSSTVISYTLCGSLPEEICGPKAAACLKNKNYNAIGEQFVLGNHNSLKLVNGSFCNVNSREKLNVTVKFECYPDIVETRLERRSDCEYNIYMINPKCQLHCTTNINNQLIDLRKLKGNYFVNSKENTNFSIALCGAKQNCTKDDSDVSICKKTSEGIIPLSRFQNERVIYNQQKNEISFRGSYKGDRAKIQFDLFLKCDWENNAGEIKYKEVATQGKFYKFVMNSPYGCVKLPPDCVIREGALIYNLTDLSNTNGYQVANWPNGAMLINVCGPLNLTQKIDNSCSRSFSQVCEINGGNYINRGSIMSNYQVRNDVIQVTYASGTRCKEDPSEQYSTHIDLYCSNTDEGPTFIKAEKCNLFINWNTSKACPTYNDSSCEYEPHEQHDCCVKFQGQYYNLNPLKLHNSSHEIDDPRNKSIKYFLNVCDSVINPDAPCRKNDMVIMKDTDEANLKYRSKSLGKMDMISVVNEKIVITTLSGTYCGREGDFTSSIHLICDSEEKKPELANNTECTYQFKWRTPQGCLNITHSSEKQCIIKDIASNYSLNFTETKQKSVKVNFDDMSYTFDICDDKYSECRKGHCDHLSVTKHLVLNNNMPFLEILLPKPCDTANKSSINKVLLELVCGKTENKESIRLKEQISNCTLKLIFYTDLICEREISTGCPTVYFYEHNTSVVLIYPSNTICDKSTLGLKYEYKAELKCSNQEMRKAEKLDCLEVYHLEGPNFCKLFEISTLEIPQNNHTGAIVLSTIGVIVLIVICLFVFYKWKVYSRRLSYLTVYEKDADM